MLGLEADWEVEDLQEGVTRTCSDRGTRGTPPEGVLQLFSCWREKLSHINYLPVLNLKRPESRRSRRDSCQGRSS